MIMIMIIIMVMIMTNDEIRLWSLVFLIYTGFLCTYNTFVIPLENFGIVFF